MLLKLLKILIGYFAFMMLTSWAFALFGYWMAQ